MTIEFEFPEDYPQVVPLMSIKCEKDLDNTAHQALMNLAKEEVKICTRAF